MTTTPSADFCRPVRTDCSILSLDSETNGRSPEVISTAFRAQPPNLQPVPLMDMDFVVTCQLVRHRMPRIRFLYIGSHVCSTLLSNPASRRRSCASLSLHLHQVVKRTFTFKLSIMLGTQQKPRSRRGRCTGKMKNSDSSIITPRRVVSIDPSSKSYQRLARRIAVNALRAMLR